MGLSVVVGLLADMKANDPEGAEHLEAELAELSAALVAAGLPPHREPDAAEMWEGEGYGYAGLHALRQVAGLLWRGLPIPRAPRITGEVADDGDALSAAVHAALTDGGACPPFAHLMQHSDAQGWYVPQDFEAPVPPLESGEFAADMWWIGSAPRLAAEVAELAAALGVPQDMECLDAPLLAALDAAEAPADAPLWQAQPVATWSVLLLRDACRASLATGAAIGFT